MAEHMGDNSGNGYFQGTSGEATIALIAGGYWKSSVDAGPRCVSGNN